MLETVVDVPDAAAAAGVIQHVDDRPMNIGYENLHLPMPHGVHSENLFRFDPPEDVGNALDHLRAWPSWPRRVDH